MESVSELNILQYITGKVYGSNFYRATARNATHGIAVGILSVCPFVRPSDACIVTKLNNALRIF